MKAKLQFISFNLSKKEGGKNKNRPPPETVRMSQTMGPNASNNFFTAVAKDPYTENVYGYTAAT